jgi:tRNA-specific 2-thiouridylase
MSKGKVLMAMSGGVDSSIASMLLQNQGYELVGATMKVWDAKKLGYSDKTALAGFNAVNDARNVAVKLGFPHYTFDFQQKFEEIVIKNFIDEYLSGRTPNPCVICNKFIKWKELLKLADQLGCEFIATGHYAQINQLNGLFYITKGIDDTKDQSYFLWQLPQDFLKRTLFPLGAFRKEEVKKMAIERGFKNLTKKPESYDICFLPEGDYRDFLNRTVKDLENKVANGNFIHTDGTHLGKHKGFPYFTIGQRKGLEVAAGYPLYVVDIQAETNTIILGDREKLSQREMWVRDFSIAKYEKIPDMFEVYTKIRYRHEGQRSLIRQVNDKIKIEFFDDVFGITPGQSAVFMEGDDIIGGGFIM